MNLKKNNKRLHFFGDAFVILAVGIYIIKKFRVFNNIVWTWQSLILTIIGVMGVLLLKAVRMYFILMEHKMPLWRFEEFYIYTSCTSLVLPFKSGEFYRIYKLAKSSKNIPFSITAVIIDRMFDSMPLCLIMIYSYWDAGVETAFLLRILCIFIITMGGMYWVFPSVYNQLNHFLIIKSETERGVRALKLLESIKKLYEECDQIIRNKTIVLLLLSTLAWTLEILIAYVNSCMSGDKILSKIIQNYLNATVFGKYNMSQMLFTKCAIVVLVAGILYCGLRILKSKKDVCNEKNNCL